MEDEDNLLNEWGAPHIKPKFTTFSTTRDVSLEHDNVGKTRQNLHVLYLNVNIDSIVEHVYVYIGI